MAKRHEHESQADMQASSLIVACEYPQAEAINGPLERAFTELSDSDFERRSHFIGGRFENLYLKAERLPGLSDLLSFGLEQARTLLSSGRADWLDEPMATHQPLRIGFWANAMQSGQSTSRHSHEEHDELLSGVYYVSARADSGDILFHDSPFQTRVQPRPGLMLLFAPALEHSVEINRSDAQRLSIAFNIGPGPSSPMPR
ncbi:MAG: putative 2OG-Fe(II) oxygenase [Lamprobacter sp.]|uniref:putative 2OG-Fe(II) oxygenase n=1 Tax=Lamprobacter sp. TaxID=3100796 RepID=UPI002B25CA85|nr:putative 2OG-Fe(II) oxygenase [Lamprobacter sp.]MEA3640558.1 putative 2OG-Fe(II) oxygenase [Lamprobacter sp.]